MKKLVVFVLCLLSVLAVAAPASAKHAWSKYHWARTANPFGVLLGSNVTPLWESFLADASTHATQNDWSDDIRGNPVDTTVTGGGSSNSTCAPTAGRVEVCNADYGSNGWLGLATVWLTSGSHITQGTAQMNDHYFSQSRYDSADWRAHVMCQEVGHTFGLGHQSTSGADLHTCMDYASSPDTDNRYPNAHDYDMLKAIYGSRHGRNPVDGYTTLDPIPQSAQRGARPYRTDRHDTPGHTEIVEHFSDGSRKVTDILWADRR